MTEITENKAVEAISLGEAIKRICYHDTITQEEVAILARGEAKRRGYHDARNLSRANISKFYYAKLPKGNVFKSIFFAIQSYLGVEIQYDIDNG